MPRTVLTLFAALALVVVSCGDDDSATAPPTSAPVPTTTAPPGDSTTTEPDGTADWQRCDNPEGFSISYPAHWAVNDGTVVAECSMWDPEPFEVPEASDERVAAISAYVDAVAFERVTGGSEGEQEPSTIDGHRAVRITGPAGELYPDDASAARYVVELSDGSDGDRTLVIDTVELPGTDFDRNVEILDRMMGSIDLTEAP